MPNINEFKSRLRGGGARANQFKVTLPFPGYAAVGGETSDLAFLCKATAIPGQTVGNVPIDFRGRKLNIAGDRTFEPWSITVLNDTDFSIRREMERWMNGINDTVNNTGATSPDSYRVDMIVQQLDRDDTVLKTYILRNCFPLVVGEVALSSAEATEIETFDVTWKYQHFEASGVNF